VSPLLIYYVRHYICITAQNIKMFLFSATEFGIVVSKRSYDSDTEERWSLRSSRLRGSGRSLGFQGSRQGSGREEKQNKENECPNPSEDGTVRRTAVRMGTRAVYSSSQWSSKETLIDKQAYSPLPEAYIISK
jgi:hypothetical protein